VRSSFALILSDDAPNLSVDASLEISPGVGPGTKVYLRWMNEITSITTEERPRDDGADVEFRGRLMWERVEIDTSGSGYIRSGSYGG